LRVYTCDFCKEKIDSPNSDIIADARCGFVKFHLTCEGDYVDVCDDCEESLKRILEEWIEGRGDCNETDK